MPPSIEMKDLNAIPDAETIASLRDEAEDRGEDVGATFSTADGDVKRLVVSPRGTCVLLNEEVSEETFNRSLTADEIAAALQE